MAGTDWALQDDVPPFIIIATAVTHGIIREKKKWRSGRMPHSQLSQSTNQVATNIQQFISHLLSRANEIGLAIPNSIAWAIHENGVILGLRKPTDKHVRPAKSSWNPGEEIRTGEGLEALAQALVSLWKRTENCQPRAMIRAWTHQIPERVMASPLPDSDGRLPRLILIRAN